MKDNQAKQVILVDDDPDYSFLVQEVIKACRPACEVKIINRGDELMPWLEANGRPTIIFLDINMPGCNGFDVLSTIKASSDYKQIPVVMLSISAHKGDIFKSYTIGANAYLIKPLTFKELSRRIELLSEYWFDTVHSLGPS
ncbi:response regulator [Spirosoma pulveris]